MDIIEIARDTIKGHSMLSGGEHVLVGLSGGADSVSLLRVLHRLKPEFGLVLSAIYVDHGLRPQETPAEIEFARRLCSALEVSFYSEKIEVAAYAKAEGLGKQEAARALRYQVYEDYAGRLGAGKIALGHTADDQVETFFMRLLRGSGAKGLTGIPPVRNKIIRPLIAVERKQIEEFLRLEGGGYITDSSNLKTDYTRNRFRHKLMPVLKEFSPGLTDTVLRTIDILSEEDRLLEAAALKAFIRLITRKSDDEIEMFLVPMESLEKPVLRRVLRKVFETVRGLRGLDFKHIEDVIRLVKKGAPGDRIHLPKGVKAVKKYSTLLISAKPPQKLGNYGLDIPGKVLLAETGAVVWTSLADSLPETGTYASVRTNKITIDAGKIKGKTLLVRARREGDFFYPAGFGKKKKLQDFFVDEKVPRDERDSVPLVIAGGDIVWIAGFRADERFKADAGTEKFLIIEIKNP